MGRPFRAWRSERGYGEAVLWGRGAGIHGAIVTTNFVLDEEATLVRMETDVDTASRLLRGVLQNPTVTVVWIGPELFFAALEMFQRHSDKRWSFTDCTSFTVMREVGVEKAFGLDRDFEEAGFDRVP